MNQPVIYNRFNPQTTQQIESNCGIDKVVRIGYTPLAERVKTIIRQADQLYALKATDFDDLTNVDPNADDLMDSVITANEFDSFQYLSMIQDIQEDIQKRNEILEQKAKAEQDAFEKWRLEQAELNNKIAEELDEPEKPQDSDVEE